MSADILKNLAPSVRVAARKLIQAELVNELSRLPPEALLKRKEAAVLCNVSESFFEDRMTEGNGPPYLKRGTRWLRYPKGELLEWFAQWRRNHRS